MERKYGRSTLGAMAARNTKTANIAKRAIASFKTSVINLTKETSKDGNISNIQRQKQLKEIEKLQNEASNILGSLYDYSEEIKEKNESFILYDNLLDEFKESMGKLDDLHNKLVNGQKSFTNTITDVKHDIHVIEEDGFQLIEEELVQHTIEYPLESSILDERSEQIQALRSSVYGIQDLYIEIGDMVEYQGDQLDDIENNMFNAYTDSAQTNDILRDIDRRGSIPWSTYAILIILITALVLIVVTTHRLKS